VSAKARSVYMRNIMWYCLRYIKHKVEYKRVTPPYQTIANIKPQHATNLIKVYLCINPYSIFFSNMP